MASNRRFTNGFIAVCLFTAAYLTAAGVTAWIQQSVEFAFYIIVMLVLLGAVGAIHKRVRFTTGVLFCLSIWGAMHMAGGLVPVPDAWPINGENRVIYSWWVIPFATGDDGRVLYGLKYDQLTHAYGFGITAWACWQGLCATLRMPVAKIKNNACPSPRRSDDCSFASPHRWVLVPSTKSLSFLPPPWARLTSADTSIPVTT